MERLNENEMVRIQPLFEGREETMIQSCFQGIMGTAWADDRRQIGCAAIILGDFCYFAGRPDLRFAAGIFEHSVSGFMILIPDGKDWEDCIRQAYGERAVRSVRYGLKRDQDGFDRGQLSRFACQWKNMEGFELRAIDQELYERLQKESWSADFCSQYPDFETYQQLGLGFVILHDGCPVAGASSYSSFRGGIEIEIDTREDYRRRGLARICGANLILECLDRGKYPGWDAANKESMDLAVQLGYQPTGPYLVYLVQ